MLVVDDDGGHRANARLGVKLLALTHLGAVGVAVQHLTSRRHVQPGGSNAGPGLVTRLPGDPLYNAGSNPARDDHFYQAGTYPAGFNGLVGLKPTPGRVGTSGVVPAKGLTK